MLYITCHASLPSRFSWINPNIRITKKSPTGNKYKVAGPAGDHTTGKSTAISTSKIRKRTLSKKNRKEKGPRLSSMAEYPHSKGDRKSPLARELYNTDIIIKINANIAPEKPANRI